MCGVSIDQKAKKMGWIEIRPFSQGVFAKAGIVL
jgi:hypothetical protein